MTTSQITELPVESRGAADLGDLAPFEVPPAPDHEDAGALAPTTRWHRIALVALLVTTTATYLYNLAASGYGNSFYAAAVEAGSKSWKAFFFGSIDSSNFITVDKPPGSLWVMDLSARLFGFSTWSVMVPGVLEGVAAVFLLYAAVRRVANPTAGLVAGAVLAATPVAALMFRFDNPDALLTLLLVASAYCMTRAIERAGTRWIVAVGALLGFAFLTKMMQAFTVVPAFGLAYLIAAPTTLRRRIGQLLASLGALLVAAGWWVIIVSLIPASDRPFIDGSPDNSIWNLIFVYNGFDRLSSGGAGGGGGGGSNFSGTPGIFRLFNDAMGGQASWLIPAALVSMVAVFIARRGAPRTDPIRAAAIIWGGWLLVTGAVFSYGQGVIHTYYTVALAPAIAALVGLGAHQVWVERAHLWARITGAMAVAGTAVWAFSLLDRTPTWDPALRWIIVLAGALGALALLGAPFVRRTGRWVAITMAALVGVACLGGPVAYAADTIGTGHTGSIPTAGPASAQGLGGGGFPGGGAGAAGGGPSGRSGAPGATGSRSGTFGGGMPPSGTSSGARAFGGGSARTGGSRTGGTARPGGFGGSTRASGGAPSGGGAGGTTTSSALVKALEHDASHYKWVAAVDGSQSAASIELATSGDPVMAIGGFNGQGGNLSLSAFEAYVAAGDIHFFIVGSSGGMGGGGGNSSSAIATWVAAHFTSETIGGQTVYNLTQSK
jgi:4-amino-4-deoxy-L-arabinose transferase-like glycosyltransferase